MLHINDLTYRIDGRLLLENASASLPAGHKVGLVGRNGSGKTTLLRLISGEIEPEGGKIGKPRNAKLGIVAQEAPGGAVSVLDHVLAADVELDRLQIEAETATDPARIAEIHLRLSDIGAHTAEARAAAILAGLGFDGEARQRSCSEFSGGWRMRIALAALLFTEPDILLLDEPSNYLDLEGSLWLESYVENYPHTVLIVSHDRDLLNRSVNGILHLSGRRLAFYAGGYDRFEKTRREQQRLQLKLKKKQDDQRRHMEAFVERFRYKATKARQAQSRLKALEKMKPIAAEIDEQVAPFLFPDPKKPLGNPLIRFEDAAVGYEPGRPVLRNLDLRIDADDRIGLLGANGNGKSTFAKLLSGRLAPLSGVRRASKKLVAGYFAQHQLDELNPLKSPYDHIAALMPDATEAQKRARLGHIGFGVEKAGTASGNLSGGEKARLLFALAAFNSPHLLILDEPTNHLDVDSRELLIHALNDYDGALVLISHDRHLMQACADRLWIVRDGTVSVYDNDMESYRRECLSERGAVGANGQKKRKPGNAGRPSRQDRRREAANKRNALSSQRKKLRDLEQQTEALSAEIAKLDEKLANPSLYLEAAEDAAALSKQRGLLAREREETEQAWLAATEQYESAAKETPARAGD